LLSFEIYTFVLFHSLNDLGIKIVKSLSVQKLWFSKIE